VSRSSRRAPVAIPPISLLIESFDLELSAVELQALTGLPIESSSTAYFTDVVHKISPTT